MTSDNVFGEWEGWGLRGGGGGMEYGGSGAVVGGVGVMVSGGTPASSPASHHNSCCFREEFVWVCGDKF